MRTALALLHLAVFYTSTFSSIADEVGASTPQSAGVKNYLSPSQNNLQIQSPLSNSWINQENQARIQISGKCRAGQQSVQIFAHLGDRNIWSAVTPCRLGSFLVLSDMTQASADQVRIAATQWVSNAQGGQELRSEVTLRRDVVPPAAAAPAYVQAIDPITRSAVELGFTLERGERMEYEIDGTVRGVYHYGAAIPKADLSSLIERQRSRDDIQQQ